MPGSRASPPLAHALHCSPTAVPSTSLRLRHTGTMQGHRRLGVFGGPGQPTDSYGKPSCQRKGWEPFNGLGRILRWFRFVSFLNNCICSHSGRTDYWKTSRSASNINRYWVFTNEPKKSSDIFTHYWILSPPVCLLIWFFRILIFVFFLCRDRDCILIQVELLMSSQKS